MASASKPKTARSPQPETAAIRGDPTSAVSGPTAEMVLSDFVSVIARCHTSQVNAPAAAPASPRIAIKTTKLETKALPALASAASAAALRNNERLGAVTRGRSSEVTANMPTCAVDNRPAVPSLTA